MLFSLLSAIFFGADPRHAIRCIHEKALFICKTIYTSTQSLSSSSTISFSLFLNIYSSTDGGAIYLSSGTYAYSLTINYCTFASCSSGGSGGAIYSKCSSFTINETCGNSNNATSIGHFFYVYSGSLISYYFQAKETSCMLSISSSGYSTCRFYGANTATLQNMNISYNYIKDSGASFDCADQVGTTTVSMCTITSNIAKKFGVSYIGWSSTSNSLTAAIFQSNFYNNTNSNSTAAIIYIDGVYAEIYNCVFSGNNCASGILIYSASMTGNVINCWISAGTAQTIGGSEIPQSILYETYSSYKLDQLDTYLCPGIGSSTFTPELGPMGINFMVVLYGTMLLAVVIAQN